MKSQNSDSKLDETYASFDYSTVKKCPSANPATLVCCNKSCNRVAYICDNTSCKCYKQHSKCPHISIQSIINTIQNKIIPFAHFQESILNKIDETIDQLSNLKEELQNQCKQNLSFYGLTTKDQNLYNALNQQKITGKQVSQLFHQANWHQNVFVQKESLDKKFAQMWKSVDAEINIRSSQFLKLLQLVKKKKSIFNAELFQASKIKMNEEDQYNLLKMFGDKVPHSAKLLYRASENNFKVDKFHDKCDNIPHTLTLCETIYGKVIGGYTPLVWDKTNKQKQDESGSSFIFSLTNKHKFTLDKSKTAIYPYSSYGPFFGAGSPDFIIHDSANTTSRSSNTQINQSYVNQNYTAGNGESYMKFTGNPDKTYYYLAKQWQVWQLEFNP